MLIFWLRLVPILLMLHGHHSSNDKLIFLRIRQERPQYYTQLLQKLQKERPFDTMIIIHQSQTDLAKIEELIQFPAPRVLITANYEFAYYVRYNWEVIVIISMSHTLDHQLMDTAATTLDFMRQVRIIIIAFDVQHEDTFKLKLLQSCEKYKMTYVLLLLHYDHQDTENVQYLQLKPYPSYYWLEISLLKKNEQYFSLHWFNMHNKTLITYTDQTMHRALVFQDSEGNLRLNGYLARLVYLFAEKFNASLKMYRPLKLGEIFSFTTLIQLTKDGQLDLPMATDTGTEVSYVSYTLDIGQGMLMVPCALPQTTQEIFGLLLDLKFLGCVVICTLVLSVAHTLIDYYYLNVREPLNFIIHDHVLPGVLGQSFEVRISPLNALRIIYFLIGFVGTNLASLFAGHLNTLLTTPPYHRQISTFNDITHSQLKILLDASEAVYMMHMYKPIEKSLILSSNSSQVVHYRNNFNTSYGYYVPSALWNFFELRQQFFTHKVFCTPKDLLVYHHIPWGLRLQYNSPYMDAMNYLIHQIHDSGLLEAWHASTFADMLKLRQVSIRDPNPGEDRKILDANDLLWIWMIVIVGLTGSCLVFMVELWLGRRTAESIIVV